MSCQSRSKGPPTPVKIVFIAAGRRALESDEIPHCLPDRTFPQVCSVSPKRSAQVRGWKPEGPRCAGAAVWFTTVGPDRRAHATS